MLKPKDFLSLEISQTNNKSTLKDIHAYLLIQDLVQFPEYFAITNSSLRFHTLAVILNDILINNRKQIIEFGSGISTLAIANLIKKNSLECSFFSVEDNEEWYQYLKSFLTRNDLQKYVNIIYAPLKKNSQTLENNLWYSQESLQKSINPDYNFNLAIIDGPAAWKPKIRLSRYPALPYLINNLSEEFSIYFDDTNRKGEKEIMSLWNQKYKLKFEPINNTSAVSIKGKNLNTIP